MKRTGLAEDVYNDHHAEEEEYHVIINGIFLVVKGLALGNDVERHNQACPG